jgi:membrane-associated phospholipid phosphatase
MTPQNISTSQRNAIIAGVTALAVVITFGVVNARFNGEPLTVDSGWMAAVLGGQLVPWLGPSLVLHEIGAGLPAFVIASAVTGALFLWNRPWGALYFAAAAIASTVVVEVTKNTIGRPRPAEALIDVGFGSYPSGHSARAAMIAVALGILLPHLWVRMLGAAYTLAMMFSRTQLGAHWVTDTAAGALTGAAVAVLCFAVVARKLGAEGAGRHPPPWR